MEYNFINKYHKEHVNTTFSYPFNVPKDIESIEMFIEVNQPERPKGQRPDLVGVGIRNNGQVRAWNCTHKNYMKLAKEYGTPGTVLGEIENGTWEVIIFPRTKSEIIELEVRVRVVLNEKHYRFVPGDPHIHTEHSDGQLSIFDTANHAKANGLEYIFITDHNISSANFSLPVDRNLLISPGVEYGLEAGHSLILGLQTPIKDFTWDPKWSCYKGHLKEARDQGAFTGINHPFWEDTAWEVGFDLPFDWVEVWNGNWRPHNQKAVDWWHEQLCQGKRIPVVGGSDCHGNSQIVKHGTPTTHAYVNEVTTMAILEAYKKGHVYITATPEGPKLSMTTNSNVIGDLMKDEAIKIEITGLKDGDEIHILTDCDTKVYHADTDIFNCIMEKENNRFCRVEVRHLGEMVLLSNPVYWYRQ